MFKNQSNKQKEEMIANTQNNYMNNKLHIINNVLTRWMLRRRPMLPRASLLFLSNYQDCQIHHIHATQHSRKRALITITYKLISRVRSVDDCAIYNGTPEINCRDSSISKFNLTYYAIRFDEVELINY